METGNLLLSLDYIYRSVFAMMYVFDTIVDKFNIEECEVISMCLDLIIVIIMGLNISLGNL